MVNFEISHGNLFLFGYIVFNIILYYIRSIKIHPLLIQSYRENDKTLISEYRRQFNSFVFTYFSFLLFICLSRYIEIDVTYFSLALMISVIFELNESINFYEDERIVSLHNPVVKLLKYKITVLDILLYISITNALYGHTASLVSSGMKEETPILVIANVSYAIVSTVLIHIGLVLLNGIYRYLKKSVMGD